MKLKLKHEKAFDQTKDNKILQIKISIFARWFKDANNTLICLFSIIVRIEFSPLGPIDIKVFTFKNFLFDNLIYTLEIITYQSSKVFGFNKQKQAINTLLFLIKYFW